MKNISKFIVVLTLVTVLLSCETSIQPTLESAPALLVVDAWINDNPDSQVVKLSLTQPYFQYEVPPPATGAIVVIQDTKGNSFTFSEDPLQTGNYWWVPTANASFGTVGRTYKLTVKYGGETFIASSHMYRTTVVDSITFKKEDRIGRTTSDTYRGQFWGTDSVGAGDIYWIRAHKNGILLDKPSEINLAYDAGFSPGSDFDGVTFITPKRNGINPNDKDPNGKDLSPYLPGDSVYVEIYSLNKDSFDFLTQVQTQTNRPGGFGELFSRPLANVSTNVFNSNSKGSQVVGFFNVSSVRGKGQRFIQ